MERDLCKFFHPNWVPRPVCYSNSGAGNNLVLEKNLPKKIDYKHIFYKFPAQFYNDTLTISLCVIFIFFFY